MKIVMFAAALTLGAPAIAQTAPEPAAAPDAAAAPAAAAAPTMGAPVSNPAPAPQAEYPWCSKTVTDGCKQRGAGADTPRPHKKSK
ncbi:MAG: hypothetical protein DI623_03270 [Sphingomonas sanxanigenens]|uniref:Fe-S oxidoreductase n=1 Tax=Sphingomonas sanxanigenens TaxID=397260 RepID=A0A2W5AE78_9SPHN|nr:MAG: hypothetical protein DI623_03270 [Sphingomonas sanxanigenens]